ncbi:hypothetical protein IG631_10047 [Alternaria alternata]|nr:hypothetical protein IG631_10047 [Alternaria alternata]
MPAFRCDDRPKKPVEDRLVGLRRMLLPPVFRNMASLGEPLFVSRHLPRKTTCCAFRRKAMRPISRLLQRLSYRTSKDA